MTMPHLTNCPHSGDGWCLACVAKLTLTYTRERPTVPGWYWVRGAETHYRSELIARVFVYMSPNDRRRELWADVSKVGERPLCAAFFPDCEWAGPILEPT